jgi:hypothetical protein
VREPPLGVPGRNGKEHRLALRREFGFDTLIGESQRADSNRLPLLQLRVCSRTFQTILVSPVIWLICGVFGISEAIWRPLRTGPVAVCFLELYLGYAPARNLRYARLPNLALRAPCAEPRQGAIYSPEGFAGLAAKVLSGSLVSPR